VYVSEAEALGVMETEVMAVELRLELSEVYAVVETVVDLVTDPVVVGVVVGDVCLQPTLGYASSNDVKTSTTSTHASLTRAYWLISHSMLPCTLSKENARTALFRADIPPLHSFGFGPPLSKVRFPTTAHSKDTE
jgi:hypothetical protein